MKQTFGVIIHAVLDGCMLSYSQDVNSSFTKKLWAVMVPEGLDFEEKARNLAMLE